MLSIGIEILDVTSVLVLDRTVEVIPTLVVEDLLQVALYVPHLSILYQVKISLILASEVLHLVRVESIEQLLLVELILLHIGMDG